MLYEPVFHVVLHRPEIPPNTGNVGRTCVATGCKLWLVKPLGFDIDEKTRRRAGLDYWQHLEWDVTENWEATRQELVSRPTPPRMWFFTKKARQVYTEVSFQRGDALIFGSETTGLPDDMLAEYAEQTVRIPTRSEVRSLNLSAAVAVAVYEALRQVERM